MKTRISALSLFVAFASFAMAETQQSGFLEDYSNLQKASDKKDEDLMLYIKPGLELSSYSAIYIPLPVVFLDPQAETQAVDPSEVMELAEYFRQELITAIGEKYRITDQPGPGVIGLRTAIVDVVPVISGVNAAAKVVLKVVNVDLGGAAIEAEFVDCGTGERLGAMTESQKGKRFGVMPKGDSKKWGHTKGAFKDWASRVPGRLAQFGMPAKVAAEE